MIAARALLAAWLAATVSMTLYPFWLLRPRAHAFALGPWPTTPGAILDFALNVAMFVPLGLFGTRAGYRRRTLLPGAALLSLFIEFAQTRIAWRCPTLVDVFANTLGALLGILFLAAWDGPDRLPPTPA